MSTTVDCLASERSILFNWQNFSVSSITFNYRTHQTTITWAVLSAPTRALACTLLQIAGCIPTFSTRGKGALGPLYQLRQVLAKGRHLLQFLLKALSTVQLGPYFGLKYSRQYISFPKWNLFTMTNNLCQNQHNYSSEMYIYIFLA